MLKEKVRNSLGGETREVKEEMREERRKGKGRRKKIDKRGETRNEIFEKGEENNLTQL